MDKQSLLKIIDGLGASDEAKKMLVNYVEENEDNPDLAENVAKILDVMADQSDMAVEQVNKLIDSVEEFRTKMQEEGDSLDEETGKIIDKFQEDEMAGIEELNNKYAAMPADSTAAAPEAPVTPAAPAPMPQNPGFGGQQYNAPQQGSAPQPAPFPTAPVMGQPNQ